MLAVLPEKDTSQKECMPGSGSGRGRCDRVELLFVYGTLRRGFNHPMARMLALRARYLEAARLNGRLYHLGRYPGVILSHLPDEWVRGDLYELSGAPGLLARLDRYEGVLVGRRGRSEYRRVVATVHLDSGVKLRAWIYLYQLPVNRQKRLVSGDFTRYRRSSPER